MLSTGERLAYFCESRQRVHSHSLVPHLTQNEFAGAHGDMAHASDSDNPRGARPPRGGACHPRPFNPQHLDLHIEANCFVSRGMRLITRVPSPSMYSACAKSQPCGPALYDTCR
jgi:hypothetical protein